MSNVNLKTQFENFLKEYNTIEKDKIWSTQSKQFQSFWYESILNGDPSNLKIDEIDRIIRILDRKGYGNKGSCESVANVMVAQGAWRKLFHEFVGNKHMSKVLTEIFQSVSDNDKAAALDRLYQLNSGKKNYLTGPSGNTINAMLAAWNPVENLSVVSLKDRMQLLHWLEFPFTFNTETASIGTRFVVSNHALLDGVRSIVGPFSSRTVSCFFYSPDVKSLWKGSHSVTIQGKIVEVAVPEDDDIDEADEPLVEGQRESIEIQAMLATIGARMGMKIWLPKSDRSRVFEKWHPEPDVLLDRLPLNYDEATHKTIEQIDVLWMRGNSIVRAFEVEHTTSIYSGILRMADLLAMQANLAIKMHIVAPVHKRERVFREIRRPVFAHLNSGPLVEKCTYLSYDSVREIAQEKHLEHLSDSVLEEFAEQAE